MKNILRTTALILCAIMMAANSSAQSTDNRQKATAAETGGNVVVYLETASWGQNYPFNEQCFNILRIAVRPASLAVFAYTSAALS